MVENESAVAFWHSHSLISDAVREGLNAYCDYSSIGPLAAARVGVLLTKPTLPGSKGCSSRPYSFPPPSSPVCLGVCSTQTH